MATDHQIEAREILAESTIRIRTDAELAVLRRQVSDFLGLLPNSVSSLRTEADIRVVIPWFMRSLSVPGDLCEFGCFRGTMSIKFAFALKALGRTEKTVYAFDTFEGFQMDDPSGGALTAGSYGDHGDAFAEMLKWGKVLPIKPIKGDARETCRLLTSPLSFVWLDIDFDVLMAPVLAQIWPLIGQDTIIGIDDVGRPETPSVLPWVERIVAEGRLVELERTPGAFIRFFRAGKA
jgi:hypothetical protein